MEQLNEFIYSVVTHPMCSAAHFLHVYTNYVHLINIGLCLSLSYMLGRYIPREQSPPPPNLPFLPHTDNR